MANYVLATPIAVYTKRLICYPILFCYVVFGWIYMTPFIQQHLDSQLKYSADIFGMVNVLPKALSGYFAVVGLAQILTGCRMMHSFVLDKFGHGWTWVSVNALTLIVNLIFFKAAIGNCAVYVFAEASFVNFLVLLISLAIATSTVPVSNEPMDNTVIIDINTAKDNKNKKLESETKKANVMKV